MSPKGKAAIAVLSLLLGWTAWKGVHFVSSSPRVHISVPADSRESAPMKKIVQKSPEEWKKALTPAQYQVLIACGTEPPFSGIYDHFWESGGYHCAACGALLFRSETKYEHGTGWPSFFESASPGALERREDRSAGMIRTEIRCAACGGHLGHVFDDGPPPTGRHYCVNSAALAFRPSAAAPAGGPETATFAAGCFWGVEEKFGRLPGVLETVVGYTGGRTENPTYEQVCADTTGHAEAVRVTFDPARISYAGLVRAFFSFHDPTQLNRQGPDVGRQYRSAVFYHTEEQRKQAEEIKAEIDRSGRLPGRLVTEIVPAGPFTRAEEYHQKYNLKNKRACSF